MAFTPHQLPTESKENVRYKQIYVMGVGNLLIVQIRNSKYEWVNAKAEDFLKFNKGE